MPLNEYITENKINISFENYDEDKILVQIYKDKQNMFVPFGLCEFISYMDWFYDVEVEFNTKDGRSGYVISKANDLKGIREDIEMFMYEYKL